MKNLSVLLVVCSVMLFSGCQIVGDIFKAGMGFGIFLVVAVIGLIIFVITRLMGGGGR